MSARAAVAALGLLLLGAATQAEAVTQAEAATPSWPAGCASFSVQRSDHGKPAGAAQRWLVCRLPDVITWQRPQRDDVWRLQPIGLSLERSEHGPNATVMFAAGELKALGVAPDPMRLATVLGEAAPAQGRRCDQRHLAYRIASPASGETLQACWDERIGWPAWLEQSAGSTRLVWRLAGHTPGDAAARSALAEIERRRSTYRVIDAADFGDLQPSEWLSEVERRVSPRVPGHGRD